jgi:hypothetical protein
MSFLQENFSLNEKEKEKENNEDNKENPLKH